MTRATTSLMKSEMESLTPLVSGATSVNQISDGGLATSRSRRDRPDKSGRLAAMRTFKKARIEGKRNFMIEEENVYDIVEESEYSKLVQERLDDDWIVDDGSGYVEDGREVFDEDLDAGGSGGEKKKKKVKNASAKEKKRLDPNIQRPEGSSNIKSMFAASAAANKNKPKVQASATALDDDELFGDILTELHSDSNQKCLKPIATNIRKVIYNPFSKPIRKKTIDLPKTTSTPLATEQTKQKKTTVLKPKPEIVKVEQREFEPELFTDSPMVTMETDVSEDDIVKDSNNSELTKQEDYIGGIDIKDVDFDEDFSISSQPKTFDKSDQEGVNLVVPEAIERQLEQNIARFATMDGTNSPTSEVRSNFGEVDLANVPLVKNEAGDEVLRFFWLDAFEDPYNQPGTVYLFGKVYVEKNKPPISCCLAVKNIERRVYLLPREFRTDLKTNKCLSNKTVTISDVYEEFSSKIAQKYTINTFRSMQTTRRYAFEKPGVPAECDYLEIRYAADKPQLPMDTCGETFSHAFNTNQSSLETFLLDRKLKGPCWLDLKSPEKATPAISWCQLEIVCSRPNHVIVTKETLATPPIVVMTLSLKTVINQKTHENEIVSMACLINQEFNMDKPAPKQHFNDHFCAISKPGDCVYPFDFRDQAKRSSNQMKIEMMGSERHLLAYFLAKIHRLDPDIVVGHDIYGFDLDVLLHRLSVNKVPHWSKIGRLKRNQMPKQFGHSGKGASFTEKSATCGRMVCDVKLSARELIRCKSYDLTELVNHILRAQRSLIEPDEIKNMYLDSRSLLNLCETNLVDGSYVLRIMYELNVIPLSLQITNICGNVMSRTLMGGRSERNEYLLLHAFYDQNYILPDKEFRKKIPVVEEDGEEETVPKKGQGRRKPAYSGGLVLEPKRGFYDKYILLLDFNSLYPSIIQEYNICFTTVNRDFSDKLGAQGEEEEFQVELPDPSLKPGILPTEIRKLVESRKQVKMLMKGTDVTPEIMMQYDIRQKALKLTANSMYGCLGFSFSRFYAKPLAALVTSKGREILMKTKDLVEKMNLEVIYGDTDSIMINTNATDLDTVFKLGNKVKAEVNKLYRLLEIDIDGVFKSMLLLKKKKYAALSIQKSADGIITEHQELKGLDIVRRDWCELAKQAGNFVVSQILSGASKDEILDNIHSKLNEVGENVAEGKIPHELYCITKQLTKDPEDYPDKKSLSHVQVALRINSKGGKRMRSGDTVYYVICHDGSNLPASQRAYHPDELAKSDTLKIDTKYYLASQVHPVVQRLCDPMDGTDAARIAECLGLDASGYKHALRQHDQQELDAALSISGLSDEDRYKDCERFKVLCKCGKEIILDSAFVGVGADVQVALASCGLKDCKQRPADNASLYQNQLQLRIRQHIKQYYQGWLLCEDPACGNRTCKLPLETSRGMPVCSQCHKGILRLEYTDAILYDQLCFYQYIFDLEKALSNMPDGDKGVAQSRMIHYMDVYRRLKSTADRAVSQNAYSQVDLAKLFAGLVVPTSVV